ncbi:MAG: histidinol dehydrogenase [Thermoleophilaceae bacterium]|nr:histidinol dehydrogenase [Thermoleophilaceae bacterium]
MRIERNARVTRREIRPGLEQEVRAILDEVRSGGDEAVLSLTERFDNAELAPEQLRVEPRELEASLGVLEPGVVRGLRTAIANVRAVVRAQSREPVSVELEQGQQVEIVEVPVRRAAIYVPGGRAAYPSTVVMGAVSARAAGVGETAVCAPPGPGGHAHPTILAACVLCEVNEVYRMGGAQAIAALAYGTESVRAVDVITGPGNPWVQEAKRQVAFTEVGIDGVAGPSELAVIADGAGVDPEVVALDLLAQAEHGADSPLWLFAPDGEVREAIVAAIERLAPTRPSVADARLEVCPVGAEQALRMVEGLAPEHLQLVGRDAEALADRVRRAGCVFVGAGAGTAFGDYVAGSNHVLPTGGAARFQSALSAATFRRRMARVSLPGEAPARLAPAGAALARAEGFPVHAESMERRV